ncbi:ABC transporter substrate-binding protein [Arthrobacter sp. STN4]|uniref:ABC transporter substrate-binding protein n=1 Tax=Arthrobacter sp. STN4 TaxID=2923276 RepID=UPI00211A6DBA|nr:ABC transporter substrate-binding protein [Arthrobacter sp. STN4]MCQ9163702.1 ABC transporter substrate-binding protein [Arthrobacter sp. STN4]
MPQPIDVGSILGGRYKITGRILASAEEDVILDGLDQVLNRPVSILVSAESNSQNLTQSAREVATGERVSKVSILDLGSQDNSTYLIAARTAPADLLDLVVPTEPSTGGDNDAVYREPFFTDTLGTEIFGSARDTAPAAGAYVYEDNTPVTPAHPSPAVRNTPPAVRNAPPARPAPEPATSEQPTAAHPAAAHPAAAPPTPPAPAATTATPKVTLWNDDDYDVENADATGNASLPKKAGTFPAAALAASDSYESQGYETDEEDEEDEEDDANAPRSGGRWLTGIIVSVLIVVGLIFAISHIGSLFNGAPVAEGGKTTAGQGTTAAQKPATSKAPAPAAVPPAVTGLTDITAYLPGQTHYNDMFIPRLPDAIDGNRGTYWPTVEFSNDTFAGAADTIDLAVELKQESTISEVTINQIGGSGGQFNVLTNSQPSLAGATKIGSGSFSAPDFTLKAAAGVKAKYVIIDFTQLPRLQPFKVYPYGLKIAEISVK